jgi:hypothetical protein
MMVSCDRTHTLFEHCRDAIRESRRGEPAASQGWQSLLRCHLKDLMPFICPAIAAAIASDFLYRDIVRDVILRLPISRTGLLHRRGFCRLQLTLRVRRTILPGGSWRDTNLSVDGPAVTESRSGPASDLRRSCFAE